MKNKAIKLKSTITCSCARITHLFSNCAGCICLKFWFYTRSVIISLSDSLPLFSLPCGVCAERSRFFFFPAVLSPSYFSFSLSLFLFTSVHSGGNNGPDKPVRKSILFFNWCFPLMPPSGTYATALSNKSFGWLYVADKLLGFLTGL